MKDKIVKAGSVITAFLASLCCIGPIVLATLGLGGAGFLSGLEAYRPYIMGMTFLFLGTAFFFTYRKKEVACEDGTCKIESGSKTSKIILWSITGLALILLAFPYVDWSSESKAANMENIAGLSSVTIPVEGMTCSSCNKAVEIAVNKLDGIQHVKADFETKQAEVQFDQDKVSIDKIQQAIDDIGYKAGNPLNKE